MTQLTIFCINVLATPLETAFIKIEMEIYTAAQKRDANMFSDETTVYVLKIKDNR